MLKNKARWKMYFPCDIAGLLRDNDGECNRLPMGKRFRRMKDKGSTFSLRTLQDYFVILSGEDVSNLRQLNDLEK